MNRDNFFDIQNHDDERASYQTACQVAEAEGFSAILDLTWRGWDEMKMQAQKSGMPYVRLEGANHPFVKGDKFSFPDNSSNEL